MELKQGILSNVFRDHFVLIVPLWNWNQFFVWFCHRHFSINCTVVELKPFLSLLRLLLCSCINCTVVELKRGDPPEGACPGVVLIVPLWNWNSVLSNCSLSSSKVLIVPLWNWNCRRWQSFCACLSINCTVVELKQFFGFWFMSLFPEY